MTVMSSVWDVPVIFYMTNSHPTFQFQLLCHSPEVLANSSTGFSSSVLCASTELCSYKEHSATQRIDREQGREKGAERTQIQDSKTG